MKISGSRVLSFLVVLWTTLVSVGMFYTAWWVYQDPTQILPDARWDWFVTHSAILGPLLFGIWGAFTIALLHYAPKIGLFTLLTFSAWHAFTHGAALIEDLIGMLEQMPREQLNALSLPSGFVLPHQRDIRLYLIRAAVTLTFTLTAAWCAKRLFLNAPEHRRLRIAITVVTISLVIGISPILGKVYLRATIPPIQPPNLNGGHGGTATAEFLRQQADSALQKAISDGDQLVAHCGQSGKALAEYRRSIENLGMLHAKQELSFRAQAMERGQPCVWTWETMQAEQKALQRARVLHTRMMSALSLTAALFLFLVLRAQQVPQWAKGIAMMAAGAVLAGWFPLA